MDKSITYYLTGVLALVILFNLQAQTFSKTYQGVEATNLKFQGDNLLLRTCNADSTRTDLLLDKNGNIISKKENIFGGCEQTNKRILSDGGIVELINSYPDFKMNKYDSIGNLLCSKQLDFPFNFENVITADRTGGFYVTSSTFALSDTLNTSIIQYSHFDKNCNVVQKIIVDTITERAGVPYYCEVIVSPYSDDIYVHAFHVSFTGGRLYRLDTNGKRIWVSYNGYGFVKQYFGFKLSPDKKIISFQGSDDFRKVPTNIFLDNNSGAFLDSDLEGGPKEYAVNGDYLSLYYSGDSINYSPGIFSNPIFLVLKRRGSQNYIKKIADVRVDGFESIPLNILVDLDNNIYIYGKNYNFSNFQTKSWLLKLNPEGRLDSAKTDIALTITAPANYSKYTPLSFTVTAKNTGTTAIKDIKIQLPPVVNTVYGGTPIASTGDYKEYCPGSIHCRTWTIPNLNAGDSATLTVPVFVLDPNGANITVNAGLVSSMPADGNPANDTASAIIIGTTPSPVGKPDIAVSISASGTTYSKFTFLNYTLTAKNTGNTEMRDVQIKFTPPSNTANPGNTTSSAGIYQDYCAGGSHCQTWRIPVLSVNQTATLVIPVFVLDPGAPITAKAGLTTSTPTDMNSTNDTGSVTVSQAVSFQEPDKNLENIQVSARSYQPVLSPNPTSDEINLEMQSGREQPIQFMFYNMQGSNIMSEQRQLTPGTNQFVFDVSNFPAGLYYVQTVGEKIYTPTVKMIKN